MRLGQMRGCTVSRALLVPRPAHGRRERLAGGSIARLAEEGGHPRRGVRMRNSRFLLVAEGLGSNARCARRPTNWASRARTSISIAFRCGSFGEPVWSDTIIGLRNCGSAEHADDPVDDVHRDHFDRAQEALFPSARSVGYELPWNHMGDRDDRLYEAGATACRSKMSALRRHESQNGIGANPTSRTKSSIPWARVRESASLRRVRFEVFNPVI